MVELVLVRNLHPHLYADDTQIYGSCSPDRAVALQEEVSECIDDVATWMRSNCLQLNAVKTEVFWCASTHCQGQLPDVPFTVGSDVVKPVRCVRNLGIYIDSDVSMRTHISRTVSSCFVALRQIRSIQRSVSRPVLLSLVTSLILSRLDYGSVARQGDAAIVCWIPAGSTSVGATCRSTFG